MSTKDIFSELLVAENITISGDPAALRSTYIMLYRKFHSYKIMMDNVGYLKPDWIDATVGMSIAAGGTIATFSIKSKRKRGSFTILAIGGKPVGAEPHVSTLDRSETQTTNSENVPANLEHHQEGTVQYGGTNQGSQEYGEDSDPSSSQGESSGVRSDAEDWRTHVRSFIESDSSGS